MEISRQRSVVAAPARRNASSSASGSQVDLKPGKRSACPSARPAALLLDGIAALGLGGAQ